MKTYILSKLDTITPTKKVTQATRPNRVGWTVVDCWPAKDQPPNNSDARSHQDWERRNGRAV